MTAQSIASSARVPTDRPQRYGKQLVSHLTHKVNGNWDDAAEAGELEFPAGRAELSCAPGALLMSVSAGADDLDRLEDVLGRHLVRFGARDELVVEWARADGTAGTTQRKTED